MTNRAVFLDRDGTLIEHYDYLTEPDQVRLLPHSAAALRLLREHDYKLIVITNQSAVARGMLTEKKLAEIHKRLEYLLNQQQVFLDKIYYCPYHPEAPLKEYQQDSPLRKPNPGMLEQAAREFALDLNRCWVVGDDDRDIQAGQTARCHTILLQNRGSSQVHRGDAKADYSAMNLQEAANLIVHYGNASSPQPPKAPPAEKPTERPVEKPAVDQKQAPHRIAPQQTVSRKPPPKPIDPEAAEDLESPDIHQASHEEILKKIFRELRQLHHSDPHEREFSIPRFLAGVLQMLVVMCLVLAFGYSRGAQPDPESVRNMLLWAIAFQVMALTLLSW